MANFQEQVDSAIAKLRPLGRNLRAEINGKVVTLYGDADNIDAKTRIMNEFNANKDTLKDPDKIKAGAKLRIP
ncbi:MAG: hypothetical protein ACYC7A_21495 [Thermoanaerobaculia bacterium]